MNIDQYLNKLVCGNNLKIVSTWPSNYFDSIITDPPYELGFMGKSWDSSGIAYSVPLWKQLLRVSKPGAFLLCFGGTRTHHRVVCAIEDAGWEIRDCMMWLYGSGFPKSHNISKAIDKAKGTERKVIGQKNYTCPKADNTIGERSYGISGGRLLDGREAGQRITQEITTPATYLAKQWDGYGTALKPAWEPIIVAMKPLDGTFAHNAETHQVAGLNIDAARIGTGPSPSVERRKHAAPKKSIGATGWVTPARPPEYNEQRAGEQQGRWPANLILDEEAGAMLDEQSGISKSTNQTRKNKNNTGNGLTHGKMKPVDSHGFSDSGGASRFFYCAKASKKERNLGCEDLPEKQYSHDGRDKPIENAYQRNDSKATNNHPTVKPLAIIKYLCTLLKMPNPNQVILDPFMGSGTTGMACKSLGINFIGIDLSLDYCHIARKRIDATPAEEK